MRTSAQTAESIMELGARYRRDHVVNHMIAAIWRGKLHDRRSSWPCRPPAPQNSRPAAGDVRPLGLPPAASGSTTHPTITEDLLQFLAQGWIVARPDIAEILPDGVRYADGTAEPIDLIIAATGYEPRYPFLEADLYPERDGRSGLYLNLFSRRHDGLVVLGLAEFAGAAFPRFDDMARAVIVELTLRELGGAARRAWLATKASDQPNLTGGRQFAASPRSAFLVDDHVYEVLLRDMADRFGYAPPPSAPSPSDLRVTPTARV
jgi:hypothetical protein